MKSLFPAGLCFFLLSCATDEHKEEKAVPVIYNAINPDTSGIAKQDSLPQAGTSEKISAIEKELIGQGLVDVGKMDSTIKVELRYSTTDNFIGVDVYGDFNKCYLQQDVAEKLVSAQKFLHEKYPFYSLIVYDAVRPLHIQRKMWDTLVLPPGEKTKYLSNPDNGSLHNYGAAVDLSIIDENGIPLDMGTPFDFFGEKAHPVREKEMLEQGILSQRQVFNREMLREIMRKAGFFGIQTEWWHFNSCRREVAAQKYKIVE